MNSTIADAAALKVSEKTSEKPFDLSPPSIPLARHDWITLALFAANSGVIATNIGTVLNGGFSVSRAALVGFLINFPFLYFSFTIIHEAAHRNITKNRKLNDIVGNIGAFWLLGSFKHFRWIHLEHHAHVNKPGLDPDLHAYNPAHFPLWCLTPFHYFWHIYKNRKKAKPLPQDFIHYISPWLLVIYAASIQQFWQLMLVWVLPSVLAVGFMVWPFDYLPHRPHKDSSKYKSGCLRLVPLWMQPFFMGQNMHQIHHLWPSIPWYRYHQAYELKKSEIVKAGIPVYQGFEDARTRSSEI